jgi:flagellar motor switch protein FliN/FliY
VVSIVKTSELEFGNLEPAIGIEIEYIEGLIGSNLMFMKKTI